MRSRLAALAAALCFGTCLVAPPPVQAQVVISVGFGPPPLPVYVQPPIPGPDYIWVPGYWAWDTDFDDYYWVPGTWVEAPMPGYLWTPGYWGWGDGSYLWHDGYWGEQIGFYGGIDYGFGYTGDGYYGGYWRQNHFFYNRAVNNIGHVHIANVYNRAVTGNGFNHTSYNGGAGGVSARPTPQQEAAAHGRHLPATSLQARQVHAARANPALFASRNQGRPPVAATARPGVLSGRGVTQLRGAPAHPYTLTSGHGPKNPGTATPSRAGSHGMPREAGRAPLRPAERHGALTREPSAAAHGAARASHAQTPFEGSRHGHEAAPMHESSVPRERPPMREGVPPRPHETAPMRESAPPREMAPPRVREAAPAHEAAAPHPPPAAQHRPEERH